MDLTRNNYIEQPLVIENELNILFGKKNAIVIFEIGACEGEDSIKYSRLFPKSKIYAFEPLPSNIKLIENNLKKYNIDNIFYYNKAVSSKEGYAEFFVSKGAPKDVAESDWDYGNKSSSLLPPDEHINLVDYIKFDEKIQVETTTLHNFCISNNIKEIDFIHMDVQGAELMVLEGAQESIKLIKAIWLEVSKIHYYKDQPLVDEIQKFMEINNFVLIKDSLDDSQGDHLYVSKTFFPNYKKIVTKFDQKKSIVERVVRKLGRIISPK